MRGQSSAKEKRHVIRWSSRVVARGPPLPGAPWLDSFCFESPKPPTACARVQVPRIPQDVYQT